VSKLDSRLPARYKVDHLDDGVSVVICTRDRPDDLRHALVSVLNSSYRDFELIVVDQSTTELSKSLVEESTAVDNRIRYIRDPGKGLSRARNIGSMRSGGQIIVFTDDDCRVNYDWLELMVAGLREDRSAGLAYGTVEPVPHDTRTGFIVGFAPMRRRRLIGRLGKLHDSGIGASMAIRREVLTRVGPFDEMLGAGAYLSSAEDCDMAYRILAGGFALLHLPEAKVLHYGWRDFQSGRNLMRRTYVAVGAAYTKPLRTGDLVGALLLGRELAMAIGTVAQALIRRQRPLGVGRLVALFVGILKSFELPVQNRPLVYKSLETP